METFLVRGVHVNIGSEFRGSTLYTSHQTGAHDVVFYLLIDLFILPVYYFKTECELGGRILLCKKSIMQNASKGKVDAKPVYNFLAEHFLVHLVPE